MNSITWKESFQLPHESNWSVNHKKGFVDGYSVKPLPGHRSSTNHSGSCSISNGLATRARYCPECAKHGYHSWFHQLVCFDRCLLHPDQDLIDLDYPTNGAQKESFYQKKGTRPIDIMLNDDIRQQIEDHVLIDCDRIAVIDVLERSMFAKAMFYPEWNESVLQTLRDCVSGQALTAARKVATIAPDARETLNDGLLENYLTEAVIPRIMRRKADLNDAEQYPLTEAEIAHETGNLRQHWDQKLKIDYQEILFLRIHKEYISILDQLGSAQIFDAALNSVRRGTFDTTICDYHTYGRIIALIFASRHDSTKYLERLYEGSWHVSSIARMDNALNFYSNDFDQHITLRDGDYAPMKVPILHAILEDYFSHTATTLGDLMAGKRCLTGGVSKGIYDTFFCMPASQYIAIWKSGIIELWACDPDVDGLLNNISQAKVIFDNTSGCRYEEYSTLTQRV